MFIIIIALFFKKINEIWKTCGMGKKTYLDRKLEKYNFNVILKHYLKIEKKQL